MTEHDASALAIVIPAFNEEGGIAKVLAELTQVVPDAQIIVVDDGSSDNTAQEISRFPTVECIRHPFNRGYGASLRTGMLAATREYVAWFDADNEHRTSDLLAMYQLIREKRLAAVIGQRSNVSASLVRALGKFVIRSVGRTFDLKVGSDLNCGLRIFRRDVISAYLSLLPQRYSASLTTTMLLVERRYPIAFFPVKTDPRIGTSKVRLKDGFAAISRLIRLVMLFAPMRIFFRLGLVLLVIGLGYGITIALHAQRGFPVAGMLVATIGVLLCMLGLIADQISQFWLSQLTSRQTDAPPRSQTSELRKTSVTDANS
jgi:glycosyltransferase involved in cell wall biosynthesis